MTEPTDAEIVALADATRTAEGGANGYILPISFCRAVLAKWGTQPQAGAVPQRWKAVPVNPTPEMWKAAKTVPDPNPPYPPHYGLVWDAMLAATPTPPAEQQAATPQPTQAQAGAVPLDEARRLFDAGWKAAALFCDREDVVADGIIGFGACPQFEAAFSAAHGIKGGQHGAE